MCEEKMCKRTFTTRPKKRLFLSLILSSLFLIALMAFLIWELMSPGLAAININLPKFIAIVLASIIGIVSIAVIGMIFTLLGINSLSFFKRTAWFSINLLFPLAVFLGKLFKINKENIERSFIEVSNQLVKQHGVKVSPDRVLILTPHCIQLDTCQHKITRDVNNCKQCGRCPVGDLLALSKRTGVHFAVATGGTFARQLVKKIRPRAILAIACERDLTSGIQDVFPLPTIGVLNKRPFGPCFNTQIDIAQVEEALSKFIQEEKKEENKKDNE